MPGVQAPAALAPNTFVMLSARGVSDHVLPLGLGVAIIGGVAIAVLLTARRSVSRRVPTWGCGGELSARTEYTATAFSKPLMMVFRAVYRPTREVEALAEVSPYFPTEVRYRGRIEPTFERYVYAPLTRAVLGAAEGMKVLQAGSLHAYLAYVLVLGVLLLIWLGGSS
jgi:hydrogenase-4 component B